MHRHELHETLPLPAARDFSRVFVVACLSWAGGCAASRGIDVQPGSSGPASVVVAERALDRYYMAPFQLRFVAFDAYEKGARYSALAAQRLSQSSLEPRDEREASAVVQIYDERAPAGIRWHLSVSGVCDIDQVFENEAELVELLERIFDGLLGPRGPMIIEGAVVAFDLAATPATLIIDRGVNQGVERGTIFEIFRGATYKGQARVESVRFEACTARVLFVRDGTTMEGGDTAAARFADLPSTRLSVECFVYAMDDGTCVPSGADLILECAVEE